MPEQLKKTYSRFLVRWKLVRETPTAWQVLRSSKLKLGYGPLSTEIDLGHKTALAITEIDEVIYSAREWLEEKGVHLWICMDSLDEISLNGSSYDDLGG